MEQHQVCCARPACAVRLRGAELFPLPLCPRPRPRAHSQSGATTSAAPPCAPAAHSARQEHLQGLPCSARRCVRSAAVQGSTRPAVAATRTGDALPAAVDESTPARAQASLVDFFRQASPYIAGHRNRTFVVVIPGEVVAQEEVADGLLADVALVHSLGVRLVLVVGCSAQIDSLLAVRGLTCGKVGGVRVTDAATMQIAMEAAGKVQLSVTAALGKGPPVFALRKHGEVRHGGPAVRVACGNFVAAKRRGVVAGVDFGDTGDVRYVDADAINVRLDAGDVVVLSNLGNSAAGEVLNCVTWDVAARAALQLHADKLLCFASGSNGLVRDAKGSIVRWLQLQEAEACLTAAATVAHTAECDANALKRGANGNGGGGASLNGAAALSPLAMITGANTVSVASLTGKDKDKDKDGKAAGPHARGGKGGGNHSGGGGGAGSHGSATHAAAVAAAAMRTATEILGTMPVGGQRSGGMPGVNGTAAFPTTASSPPPPTLPPLPAELSLAASACRSGVPRCHILDATVEGALLLELYTCDGVGTMVSQDTYEGTRPAGLEDAPRIAKLLAPLEADGTLIRRDKKALVRDVAAGRFTVVERDGKVVASAALVAFPEAMAAEVAAFAVDMRYRGSGRGDALLTYLEQKARAQGAQKLFLLTTRAADWFQARGFRPAGRAAGSPELPPGRQVDPARMSLLFVKRLDTGDE